MSCAFCFPERLPTIGSLPRWLKQWPLRKEQDGGTYYAESDAETVASETATDGSQDTKNHQPSRSSVLIVDRHGERGPEPFVARNGVDQPITDEIDPGC